MNCVWSAAGYVTLAAVPTMGEPPFGATANAKPATADCVWSSAADQVTVTVVPSVSTVTELIVTAVVLTVNERIEL